METVRNATREATREVLVFILGAEEYGVDILKVQEIRGFEKVTSGTELVEQAGDTIQALVIDVKRVSELMASIAEASAEQARGVQQVNKTVTEMDKVVQQNASAVQESASAAEGMRQQAESLVKAVGAFRLTTEDRMREVPALAGSGHAPHVPRAPALAVSRAAPVRAKAGQPAAATAGDDWEEF